MLTNHSRYTLSHSEHPLLPLLPRFYPPKLKVDVISGGEESTCLLEDVAKKEFPLVLELTCSRAYTLYHCLNDCITRPLENPSFEQDVVRTQIAEFLKEAPTRITPSRVTWASPLPLGDLRAILISLPPVRRLGLVEERFYIGYGNPRAMIAEVTSAGIADSALPGFDLDDGFFDVDTGKTLSAFQPAFKRWKGQGYLGPILM